MVGVEMNWTKEKPKEHGWYWHRLNREDKEPIIVDVYGHFSMRVDWPDHSSSKIEDVEGEWCGPLTPPDQI